MSHFLQLHLLTSYPPANLNRDEQGRPKTAMMGGAQRLRVSSQSLKRAWRTSELFEEALASHMGKRTKRIGVEACKRLMDQDIKEKQANEWAASIATVFGKVEKGALETGQLVHVGPEEWSAVNALVDTLAQEQRAPTKEELDLLRKRPAAVDIGLFGRMLAEHPSFNVEAACQVAHAITVHAAEVEDDYFTAVDDLNTGDEHRGAAHVGEAGYGAGLFYLYLCIDRRLLEENLNGDKALADQAIVALTQAAARISPKGKQNSFGSRAQASYVLAESGDQQPRSLSVAFLRPVRGEDMAGQAITALEQQVEAFDGAYGPGADRRFVLCAVPGVEAAKLSGAERGNLDGLTRFITEQG
ncbi:MULTISPECIES: type I-E CRISPR-associated protein Cas7/Cse4/CasC [unclassified Halomonas]|uniref:type I-E CRISPR-associated protein Cas7/Cse4/CasC n=1 Tax=unclassified Halomonas TaxID=2609666 RepID=UPI000F5FC3A8|nr:MULTISPECIES: type I-E CRISPR-associated protein Cas7/Cse4/CasC [unclassified Halomonas]MCJ8285272.1 type I-E CRISPR-associated protein Cas7/Cse4/CasC [Halomonas sp.]NQY70324.1 type I-E CRISPR-associated protein Cas7/Cse4/CasC [Halomonas sp.]RQW68810.1 type I-E CRISPR-associated protein Cas7/Cse4/CasC [Halomonas sp. YLB-10]